MLYLHIYILWWVLYWIFYAIIFKIMSWPGWFCLIIFAVSGVSCNKLQCDWISGKIYFGLFLRFVLTGWVRDTQVKKTYISPPVGIRRATVPIFLRLHTGQPALETFTGLFLRSFWLSQKLQCDWMTGKIIFFVILVNPRCIEKYESAGFFTVSESDFFVQCDWMSGKIFTI